MCGILRGAGTNFGPKLSNSLCDFGIGSVTRSRIGDFTAETFLAFSVFSSERILNFLINLSFARRNIASRLFSVMFCIICISSGLSKFFTSSSITFFFRIASKNLCLASFLTAITRSDRYRIMICDVLDVRVGHFILKDFGVSLFLTHFCRNMY